MFIRGELRDRNCGTRNCGTDEKYPQGTAGQELRELRDEKYPQEAILRGLMLRWSRAYVLPAAEGTGND